MADETIITSTTTPKKRRGFLKVISWVLGIFLVLVIALYFVGTSAAFLKGVILPKVSKSLNAQVTVSDASIHPFKEVVLNNFKIQTTGPDPLLVASEVTARYSLMDIIRGNINVDEVTVKSPTIVLVTNPDGSSNLDPITKASKENARTEKQKTSEPSSKPSKPTQINLKKLAIEDATIRQITIYKGGSRDVTELSHVKLEVQDVRNGQTGKAMLSSEFALNNNPPASESAGSLQGKVDGNFSFALTPDLKPGSVQGTTHVEISKASGSFAEAASLATDLDCQVSPTEIKGVSLKFSKSGATLGQLLVSGPFDLSKTEGKLTIQVVSIDKQLLNIAGAKSGVNFGTTTFNSTNQVELSKGGSIITASGNFNLNKLQVTRTNQTTPVLDLITRYDVTVDRAASNATLRDLTINGAEQSKPLLHAELTSPMHLSWGNAASPVGDSSLNFTVTGLNLADWHPFLGELASSGLVNAQAKLLSQESGKQLTFNLDSRIENLTAQFGSNKLTQATVTLQANGRATDLKQFNLTTYKVELGRQDKTVATVSGTGTYDQTAQNADMQVNVTAELSQLLQIAPQPDAEFSSGKLELQSHVIQRAEGTSSNLVQTVTGSFSVTDLVGHFGKNEFKGFATSMNLDITKNPQELLIRRINGKLSEGGKPGGTFDLSGTYSTNAIQLTAKMADLNQDGLRPFLEPLLTDKKLTSVSINATANTQRSAQGDMTVNADLQVTNLVVNDPSSQIPSTPLEAKCHVDVGIAKQIADIRQFSITLTPTQKAKNEIRLTGRLDMSQTNTQGNLKIAADSLDVTSYYDLFAGENRSPKPSSGKPDSKANKNVASAGTSSSSDKEPDAKQLPFRNFVAEMNVGRFYLREVEITNLQTTVKIDGGRVLLDPFQLALNGAPVNAKTDIDLGVPGYKYDTTFGMQAVPLAPLVNTFQPERKGQVGGTMTADIHLAGAGTTGASLQKSLNGKFDVTSTNLNLSVVNIKSRVLKSLINVVAAIPELLSNPQAGIASALQGITGSGGGGLTEELKRSPINSIAAHGSAGSGRVDLQQAMVQSPAFRADAKGTVTLASILTNSAIQIPVAISLSQPIAQKVHLVAADTPTNASYSKLPDFYTMKGTVGEPVNDINKMALLSIAAKGIVGAVPLGGSAGSISQGLTGLLGGNNSSQGTNSSGTNQTGNKLGGLLNNIIGGNTQPSSQPPSTATNKPATNQSPVNNLLNDLLTPRKK